MEIVPTILGGEFYEIENKIKILSNLPKGLISRASIDVVDGKFAEPASWPYTIDEDVDSAINEFKSIMAIWATCNTTPDLHEIQPV